MTIIDIATQISEEDPTCKGDPELSLWMEQVELELKTCLSLSSLQDPAILQAIFKILPFYCKIASLLKKVSYSIKVNIIKSTVNFSFSV
jgi:hypothetical protein